MAWGKVRKDGGKMGERWGKGGGKVGEGWEDGGYEAKIHVYNDKVTRIIKWM